MPGRRSAMVSTWAAAVLLASGCASGPHTGAASPPAAAGVDSVFRATFDQTVPSIEAALPLAARVDSVETSRTGDGSALHASAWFADHEPVALELFLIERGDTVTQDRYYYQRGALVAWVNRMHPRDPTGARRTSVTRAAVGHDGQVVGMRTALDGAELAPDPRLRARLMHRFRDSESLKLEQLRAKARRIGV